MKVSDSAQRLGFLVSDVHRLYGRRFEQFAQRMLPMPRAQCRVLVYLAENRGASQAVLADILELSPITLGRMLDRMEAAGWIRRRADTRDASLLRLYLTRSAVEQLHIARNLSDEVRREALQGLTAFESVQLTQLLQKVRRNLGTVVPKPVDTVVPAQLRQCAPGVCTASGTALPVVEAAAADDDALADIHDLRDLDDDLDLSHDVPAEGGSTRLAPSRHDA